MTWFLSLSLLGCASHRGTSSSEPDLADYGAELWAGKGDHKIVLVEWYSPQINALARVDMLPKLESEFCSAESESCHERFAKSRAKAELVAAEPVEHHVSVWFASRPSSFGRSPDCETKGLPTRALPVVVTCDGNAELSLTLEQEGDGLRVELSERLARGGNGSVEMARANPVAVGFDVARKASGGSPELAWVGELAVAAEGASSFDVTSLGAAYEHRGIDPSTIRWWSAQKVVKGMEKLVFRLPMMSEEDQHSLIQETVDSVVR